MKKLVTVVLPVSYGGGGISVTGGSPPPNLTQIVLVVLQNIVNSIANQDVGDYIANSSSISLSLIFLLPSMYPISTYKSGFGVNDFAVLLIFVACLTALIRTVKWWGGGSPPPPPPPHTHRR